uniref:Uncharacterized protein n=1 Tax=Timema tahoe TaxID=61484 RepID=A0A7R9IK46_9NEOP|nr:unnamed protein product [Timema tahoe]
MASQIVGSTNICYASERSEVNPQAKYMVMKTRNVSSQEDYKIFHNEGTRLYEVDLSIVRTSASHRSHDVRFLPSLRPHVGEDRGVLLLDNNRAPVSVSDKVSIAVRPQSLE